MSLLPGTRLAQYEILSSLGAGGMYRARDQRRACQWAGGPPARSASSSAAPSIGMPHAGCFVISFAASSRRPAASYTR
jgi:hypothetical protein